MTINQIEKCNKEMERLVQELRKPIAPARRRDIMAALKYLREQRQKLSSPQS